jgi:hypothetical protein
MIQHVVANLVGAVPAGEEALRCRCRRDTPDDSTMMSARRPTSPELAKSDVEGSGICVPGSAASIIGPCVA